MDLEVQQSFERKIERKFSIGKWLGGFVAVFVIAPLLTLAAAAVFTAAVFTLACIVIAALVVTAIVLWEPFMFKLRNKRLQLLREEAEKNPIETLLSNWEAKGKQIEEIKKEQIAKAGETENFARSIEQNNAIMSAEQRQRYKDDLTLMQAEDLEDLKAIVVLESTHTQEKIEIDRVNVDWQMANSMKRRSQADFLRARQDLIAKITNDAALASVARQYSVGIAGVRQRAALREARAVPALSNNPSPALVGVTSGIQSGQYIQR